MFYDKNNRYSLLYISDDDEYEAKPFKRVKSLILGHKDKQYCTPCNKKFCREYFRKKFAKKYSKPSNNIFLYSASYIIL